MNRKLGLSSGLALLVLASAGAGAATPDPARTEAVAWTASVAPDAKPGNLTLTLHADVQKGWHVYALKQLPGGPTPLLVKVDPNDVASAGGEAMGSPPTKIHDPDFNLDTEFYARAFTVSLPLRLAAHAPRGQRQIPLSVRFQTCNGQICQPPKLIHLAASLP
ncbi:MAG TPA: protein-disulfide reductase DsbD N-terminal domain-containing protein [Rhizomicrobium sp.]|nr:protein-disulfide reductase DsbD N-terminal domain-containing protein [Rhizomicrobium sp.]